jgi:beta-lactamase class A
MILSRRDLLHAAAAVTLVPAAARAQGRDPAPALQALEAKNGGRLGVCMLDTGSARVAGHRMDERFAMCSTFKLPLAAVVLREADQARLALTEALPFSQKDMLSYAPVTSQHLKDGRMTVEALAEAAQVTSDNVAANLLLARLGGPAAFTARLREVGDRHTRLDRMEPELNLVVAGDERDTTTPRAMAATVGRFLTGDLLQPASRDRLLEWMVKTRTGEGLARGRQDRHRHGRRDDRQVQRRRHRVSAGEGGAGDRRLLRYRRARQGHARRGPGRARRGRPPGGGLVGPLTVKGCVGPCLTPRARPWMPKEPRQ